MKVSPYCKVSLGEEAGGLEGGVTVQNRNDSKRLFELVNISDC